jgi:hypothetical protein
MTGRMNWSRQQSRGRNTDPAFPRNGPPKGAWTHTKRQPVRTFSRDEIAALLAERNDPKKPGPA